MRGRALAGAVVVACCGASAVGVAGPPAAGARSAAETTTARTAWPPREPLGTAGRWVVDGDGRVVVVRGLNLVDKRPPYHPGARGWRPEVARWLRRQGFTAVRLGWIHKGLEPDRGVLRDEYVEAFARDVRVATDAGLLVLVDLHQDYFNEATGGEGFPDWMVLVPGVPPRPDRLAFDLFWADVGGMQAAVARAWARIAARLRDEPGLLGYDLLNEPYPGTLDQHCAQLQGCREWDRLVLDRFHRRVAAGVRGADPRRPVWVEPHVIFNQGAASWVSRPGGAAAGPAGFSFHVYCSELPEFVPAPPCAQRRPRAFEQAEQVSRRTGMALLMTEFGATDRRDVLEPVLDEADARSLGWLEWALWNHDPFAPRPHEGLVHDLHAPPAGENVKAGKLALLARPYPRAVAGTPRGWSWDASARELVVRWSTDAAGRRPLAAGAATEIVLPPTAFPSGWTARVEGGRVLGPSDGAGALVADAPEADVLRVVAGAGAREVTARVVAGRPARKPKRPARGKRKASAKRKAGAKRPARGKRKAGGGKPRARPAPGRR